MTFPEIDLHVRHNAFCFQRVTIFITILYVSCFSSPVNAFEESGFQRLATEHFSVVGNALPSQLEDAARTFEDVFGLISASFPVLVPQLQLPIQACVLSTRDDFNEMTLYRVDRAKYRFESDMPQVFFEHYPDGARLVTWRGGIEQSLQDLAREMARFFVRSAIDDPPVWLEEGICTFFEYYRQTKTHIMFGNIRKERFETLRSAGLLPIGRMIRVPGNSSLLKADSDSREAFLVQSALFINVMFYADDATIRNGLMMYLKRLINGEDRQEAFLASFSVGFIGLQDLFQKSIEGLKYPYTNISRDRLATKKIRESETMERALVDAYCGNEFLRHGNLVKAQQYFTRGIDNAADSLPNNAGMAKVLLAQNKTDAALPYLNHVLSTEDCDSHRDLAFFYLSRAQRREALDEFLRCGASLDETLSGLKAAAICAVELQDNASAVRFLEKIVSGLPDTTRWIVKLCDVLQAEGDFHKAASYSLRLLQQNPDPLLYVPRFVETVVKVTDDNQQASFLLHGLQIIPNNGDLLLTTARLYDRMNNVGAAVAYYRRAVAAGKKDESLVARIAELEQKQKLAETQIEQQSVE